MVGQGSKSVPDGLIHDWMGAVFIPNATMNSLSQVLHDYDEYKDIYKPVVAESRRLGCAGENQEVAMVWQRKVPFVNTAMEGHYVAHDIALSLQRGYYIADV